MVKLNLKDRKILNQLDINSRQSNNQIGKKVKLSKEVVKYRIDRMLEEGVIVRFHTVVNYFKLGITKYKLYLRLTNTHERKVERICEYFRRHKKTEWVARTTGRWDVIVGFLVMNVNEFDDEVQAVLQRFSRFIQDKSVSTTLYLAHHERRFLDMPKRTTNKKIDPSLSVVYHSTRDEQEEVDAIDDKILRIIANNARMPVTEIAKRIRSTARVVQYRLRALEKKKIILAYKVHLNPRKMERIFCKAIVYLTNVTKPRLEQFVSYSSSLPGAVWPQRVLGDWDYELDFEADSYDAFQDLLYDLNAQFSDVIRDHSFCIVSEEFKLDLYRGCTP